MVAANITAASEPQCLVPEVKTDIGLAKKVGYQSLSERTFVEEEE